jgi:hypothetical protein
MLLRAIAVWLVIAAAETVHGIIRVRLLNRRVGDRRARQIGVLSGSLIIVALVWSSISWVGVRSVRDCLGIGLFLVNSHACLRPRPWTSLLRLYLEAAAL